ncbi:MAG: ROK family transcriptional regulator [Deltaproteobacteria bacterium]|jgi:predicted NBD/HSP70 family sugar kinase|nr:ROK family transcriptional regulator [Deltaproteobacteria bacterium]
MPLNSLDLKRLNRINLYRAILKEETVSRGELASRLGLSLPTVAQNVKDLFDQGLIQETGTLASTGGRKAGGLAPLANARLAAGADITRNHLSLALVNLKGEVLAWNRRQLKFANTPEYYAQAGAMVEGFLAENQVETERLLGLGVSLPGIVSEDGSALLYSHMLNLDGPLDIRLPLTKREVKQKLFNDATAACLAELWLSTQSQESFFFFSLSNSVGGCLVIYGRIFPGHNQRAGETGHIIIDPHGPVCYCGVQGHYDSFGSALNLSTPAGGRLESFFEGLKDGNPEFTAIFEKYLESLAWIVVSLRALLDCDIVLGGYVGGFLGPYLEEIKRRVLALDTFKDESDYLRLSRHKMEGAAVGVALNYIDNFINSL